MRIHKGKEEGLKQNLKGKFQAAGITHAGPACVCCGEPIDTRSNRNNGNVTQGWAHEDCLPYAEKAERDLAEAEPAYEYPPLREYTHEAA